MKGDGEAIFIEVAMLIAVILLITLLIAKLPHFSSSLSTQEIIEKAQNCRGECYVGKIGAVDREALERAGIVIKYWEENATYIKLVREGNITYVVAWK